MKKNLVFFALKEIAVALGIAAIVISILGALAANSAISMLGIGLAAFA